MRTELVVLRSALSQTTTRTSLLRGSGSQCVGSMQILWNFFFGTVALNVIGLSSWVNELTSSDLLAHGKNYILLSVVESRLLLSQWFFMSPNIKSTASVSGLWRQIAIPNAGFPHLLRLFALSVTSKGAWAGVCHEQPCREARAAPLTLL